MPPEPSFVSGFLLPNLAKVELMDGVMTQDEADALTAPPSAPGRVPAPSGTRQARPQTAQNVPFPDISTVNTLLLPLNGATPPAPGFGQRGGFGLGRFNLGK